MTSAQVTPASFELREEFPRTGAPRDLPVQPGDHTVEQTLDDLVGGKLDSTVFLHVGGRIAQVEPDHGVGMVIGPLAVTEPIDEVTFGCEPVRFGVDERAVHVPQDGRRQQDLTFGFDPAGVRGRHSCTSSIRVPKLPFGCTNATVVPRLPGRGSVSIGVAPASTIDCSAAAQSSTR